MQSRLSSIINSNSANFHVSGEDDLFLGTSIPAVDTILTGLKSIDSHHPLAELTYEAAMLLRELLNSWSHLNSDINTVTTPTTNNTLNNDNTALTAPPLSLNTPGLISSVIGSTAIESWINRTQRIHTSISVLSGDNQPKLISSVEVYTVKPGNNNSNYKPKTASVHYYLLHIRSDKKFQSIDLRQLLSVDIIHNSSSGSTGAELSITIISGIRQFEHPQGCRRMTAKYNSNNTNNSAPTILRQYNIRYNSSIERSKWFSLFQSYVRENKLITSLYNQSIEDRIDLYQNCIFKEYPTTDNDNSSIITLKNKKSEYLFSTVYSAVPSQQYLLGIRDRFTVSWHARLSRNKMRDVEFDYSDPNPTIRIYRLDSKIPELILSKSDIIDYTINNVGILSNTINPTTSNYETNPIDIEFHYILGSKIHHRKYVFDNSIISNSTVLTSNTTMNPINQGIRFYDRLIHFITLQKPNPPIDTDWQSMIHQNTILILRHYQSNQGLPSSTDTTGTKQYKSHIHSLFIGMREVAPTSSINDSLCSISSTLPNTAAGDSDRLLLLVSKLISNYNYSSEFQFRCDCTADSNTIASFKPINHCILYSIQSLLYCDGFNMVLYYLFDNSNSSPYSQLLKANSLKLLYLLFSMKFQLIKCRTKLTISTTAIYCDSIYSILNDNNGSFNSIVDELLRNKIELNSILIDTLFQCATGNIKINYLLYNPNNNTAATATGNSNNPNSNSALNAEQIDTPININTLINTNIIQTELTDILTEQFSINNSDNHFNVLGKSIRDSNLIPLLLHYCNRLIIQYNSFDTVKLILTNLLLLLPHSSNNRIFLDYNGFQNWIIPLTLTLLNYNNSTYKLQLLQELENYFNHTNNTANTANNNTDNNNYNSIKELLILSISLMSTLLYYSLLNTSNNINIDINKLNYKSIELYKLLEILINSYGWSYDHSQYYRIIILNVLNLISQRVREYSNNYDLTSSRPFELFYYVINTVEDYLFYRGTDNGINTICDTNINTADDNTEDTVSVPINSATTTGTGAAGPAGAVSAANSTDLDYRSVISIHYDRDRFGRSTGICTDIILIEKLIELLVILKLGPQKENIDIKDFTAAGSKNKIEKSLLKQGYIETEFWRICRSIFLEFNRSNNNRDIKDQERLSIKLIQFIQKRDKDLNRSGTGFFSFGSKKLNFNFFQIQIDTKWIQSQQEKSSALLSIKSTTAAPINNTSIPTQSLTFRDLNHRRLSTAAPSGSNNPFTAGIEWDASEGDVNILGANLGSVPTVQKSESITTTAATVPTSMASSPSTTISGSSTVGSASAHRFIIRQPSSAASAGSTVGALPLSNSSNPFTDSNFFNQSSPTSAASASGSSMNSSNNRAQSALSAVSTPANKSSAAAASASASASADSSDDDQGPSPPHQFRSLKQPEEPLVVTDIPPYSPQTPNSGNQWPPVRPANSPPKSPEPTTSNPVLVMPPISPININKSITPKSMNITKDPVSPSNSTISASSASHSNNLSVDFNRPVSQSTAVNPITVNNIYQTHRTASVGGGNGSGNWNPPPPPPSTGTAPILPPPSTAPPIEDPDEDPEAAERRLRAATNAARRNAAVRSSVGGMNSNGSAAPAPGPQ